MEARQTHEIQATFEGASEADPDALLQVVFGCLDRLLGRMGHLQSRIGGVATCTFVNNILGLNENNRAITPLTTYADTRAEGEVPQLRSDFDETMLHDRTGCRFHPSYLPARFRWLARANPHLFRASDPLGIHWRVYGAEAFRRDSGELLSGFLDRAVGPVQTGLGLAASGRAPDKERTALPPDRCKPAPARAWFRLRRSLAGPRRSSLVSGRRRRGRSQHRKWLHLLPAGGFDHGNDERPPGGL